MRKQTNKQTRPPNKQNKTTKPSELTAGSNASEVLLVRKFTQVFTSSAHLCVTF